MNRWKQYGGLAGLCAFCLVAGLWGFTSTGGSLPWAKRSAQALQRGAREGSGALIDLSRGVLVAGPIRKGGMMLEFFGVVVLMIVFAIGLYVYASRYRELEDSERTAQ
ncbi:hypothetical protein [Haloquadratum walsbyi]|jgi:hypothetical protein|uniref:Cobalamin transport operon protein n=1 Tax=Haloquadratum walsbyi J07HQW2 TaxID=1238425 RepID=U1PL88_9EURY|nr:hypothetical protein [Haloquadratum walsbyi]ERG94457.1 MAG: hypothetical protein J07HQW2_00891 [Haloquadratum walsbyi J07HQW2]